MERSLAVQRAQRHAFDTLKKGVGKIRPVPAENITMPAMIRQEIAFVATTSLYTFRCGSDAPAETTSLGNKLLGDNDVIAIYGIRVLHGEVADQTIRVYRSRGITSSDDALYNGELKMEEESRTAVAFMLTNAFRDESTFDSLNGLVLIYQV